MGVVAVGCSGADDGGAGSTIDESAATTAPTFVPAADGEAGPLPDSVPEALARDDIGAICATLAEVEAAIPGFDLTAAPEAPSARREAAARIEQAAVALAARQRRDPVLDDFGVALGRRLTTLASRLAADDWAPNDPDAAALLDLSTIEGIAEVARLAEDRADCDL